MRIGCLWIIIAVLSFYCNNSPKDNWVPSKDNAHFYAYPLRDSFLKYDSFRIASRDACYFNSFKENNLSFSSPQQPIYRLVYFADGLDYYSAILTLTNEKMVVKELVSGYTMLRRDIEELDSTIRRNIIFINEYLLLEIHRGISVAELFRDSVNSIYPDAISFQNFREYEKTVYDFNDSNFSFVTRSVPISRKRYTDFVQKINNSGYWTMPIKDARCVGESMHAGGYLLEVATPEKYRYVDYMNCHPDSSALKKVINELLDFSGIEKNHQDWRKNLRRKK